MPDARVLSAKELAERAGWHMPGEHNPATCADCLEDWPCDYARLYATLRERDELLAALAAVEPTAYDRDDLPYCVYCEASWSLPRVTPNPDEHEPDCPWRRARDRSPHA